MSIAEVLSALGTPARTAARVLLAPRYAINGFQPLRHWMDNDYARARYGRSYIWRVWLLFDCKDLELLENLINDAKDDEVLHMRDAKMKQFKLVTLAVCTRTSDNTIRDEHYMSKCLQQWRN
jgi:hypothetical protein